MEILEIIQRQRLSPVLDAVRSVISCFPRWGGRAWAEKEISIRPIVRGPDENSVTRDVISVTGRKRQFGHLTVLQNSIEITENN